MYTLSYFPASPSCVHYQCCRRHHHRYHKCCGNGFSTCTHLSQHVQFGIPTPRTIYYIWRAIHGRPYHSMKSNMHTEQCSFQVWFDYNHAAALDNVRYEHNVWHDCAITSYTYEIGKSANDGGNASHICAG